MNQFETKTVIIEDGAANLREGSNTTQKQLPRLTIMQPVREAYNGEPAAPATSIQIHSQGVRQLFELLKDYYEKPKQQLEERK